MTEQITNIEELRKQSRDDFNAMPFEQRVTASTSELFARINDLERAKERLKTNYNRELGYLEDRIAGYKRSIRENFKAKENGKQ
jgi:ABC-type phosphate transport system auxiliary subunit